MSDNIEEVIAGTGLTGGGSSGTVTLAVADGGIVNSMLAANAVRASNIASGQVVKSLNGLTDNITLAPGANVTITPSGNTVTVATPIIGFTELDAILPLVLSTPDAGVTLYGEIDITPTNDGGAVALQSALPTYQTGWLGIDYIAVEPITGTVYLGDPNTIATNTMLCMKNISGSTRNYVNITDDANALVFSVDYQGATNVTDLVAYSASVTHDFNFGSGLVTFSVGEGEVATFNLPVDFNDLVAIGTTSGYVAATNTTLTPFALLSGSSTRPLIDVTSTVDNGGVLLVTDQTDAVSCSLDTNGNFYARSITVGAVEQAAGSVVLEFDNDATVFACNAVSAPVTFTLPTITGASPSGYQLTFKKTDVSGNRVMVSASGGQAIDGVTDKVISSQWGTLKLVSIVSGSTGYWITV